MSGWCRKVSEFVPVHMQHLQLELEKATSRIVYLEGDSMGREGHRNEAKRPALAAEEEPLSKRLRALHVKNDKGYD